MMLIFDDSHMTEKIWRCSIFEADHAIKNMITRQDVVFNLIGSGNEILALTKNSIGNNKRMF